MSLKDSWQQQRQERQQEVIQRQRSVYQNLEAARQERQVQAAQLRDELSLFREAIASEDKVRRINFQQVQAELQQFCAKLQTEVQIFLKDASDRRQVQAQEVAQKLDAFVQVLRQETAELLAVTAADRKIMAQQVEQELVAFIEALRADVQSYLWEMETIRKDRAEKLHQELAQSRLDREAEMKEIFHRLAEFRAELQQFCAELRYEVWGSDVLAPTPVSSTKPIAPKSSPKIAPKGFVTVKPTPNQTSIGASQQGNSIAITPANGVKPVSKDAIAYEKEVYNYIHQTQGARLTQIETTLGINRFQAVDALRSLIKKGLITQRDRLYIAHEDLVQA
ncbi:hypothetical protein K9N68_27025 [Kovacikia minuta CCNUW1]|uniref:hypothetical protein n=1 Tax=Kovacikia minuta TaxID=2931930 RepID=UPI001CC96BCA|nr:hypothetical protein [Kovacikia minuta]UBF25235.1 hypothetical protein K9N68_27025 [Kovacikia minuta CCNUW1]